MIKGLMRTVAGKLEDSTINRSHKGKTLTMDSHPKCFYLPCTQVHGSGGTGKNAISRRVGQTFNIQNKISQHSTGHQLVAA